MRLRIFLPLFATTRLSSRGVGACFSLEVFGGRTFWLGEHGRRRALQSVQGPAVAARRVPLVGVRGRGVFDGKAAAVQAKAAQATGTLAVTIKKGDPSRSIRLDGAAKRPARTGHRAGRAGARQPRGPEHRAHPRAPGTPPPTGSRRRLSASGPQARDVQDRPHAGLSPHHEGHESKDPGPARVTARVSGRGAAHPRLRLQRRPDQKVTFVEIAPAGKRTIGTVTGGKGTLTFAPAPAPTRGRSKPNSNCRRRRRNQDRRTSGPLACTSAGRSRVTVTRRASRCGRLQPRRRGRPLRDRDHGARRRAAQDPHPQPAVTISAGRPTSGGRVTVRAVAPMREGAGSGPPASAPRHRPRRRASGRHESAVLDFQDNNRAFIYDVRTRTVRETAPVPAVKGWTDRSPSACSMTGA